MDGHELQNKIPRTHGLDQATQGFVVRSIDLLKEALIDLDKGIDSLLTVPLKPPAIGLAFCDLACPLHSDLCYTAALSDPTLRCRARPFERLQQELDYAPHL